MCMIPGARKVLAHIQYQEMLYITIAELLKEGYADKSTRKDHYQKYFAENEGEKIRERYV
ncbi:hypothetical protein OESDEN_11691 [Oesophagostomum dentatum]|uniref:Uncharacterized protein n=1 Tax=Oesophagostomum dentatum TaxID=61180 RepID=A0A0B1ST71_OESDE|nr:hypothetical protein OESDEN_11691 [Oesophagostomum dentatum]